MSELSVQVDITVTTLKYSYLALNFIEVANVSGHKLFMWTLSVQFIIVLL